MKFFTVLLLLSQATLAAEPRSIAVSGTCLKRVTHDRGSVTLVAQFTEKVAAHASRRATETYEKIREAVLKLNLKDLEMQTSEVQVREDVDFVNNKRVSRGMLASLGLQISTSEISRLGEIAALPSKLEINRVDGLATYVSGEKTKAAREECLVEAIKNARDKALKMAQAADAKIGDVLFIDENPGGLAQPQPEMAMMMADAPHGKLAGAPMIESKPDLINVAVFVKFALK